MLRVGFSFLLGPSLTCEKCCHVSIHVVLEGKDNWEPMCNGKSQLPCYQTVENAWIELPRDLGLGTQCELVLNILITMGGNLAWKY